MKSVERTNRKGTELSMNVIIIAAISLVIMVLLIMLVMNSFTNVGEANKCSSLDGGICIMSDMSCSDVGPGYVRFYKSCPEGQICCAKTPVEE